MKTFDPLPRVEVIKAVERKNPRRIPLVMAKWWGEGFEGLHGEALTSFDKYPEDAVLCLIKPFDYPTMNLPWALNLTGAYDARAVLPDWAMLDEFIAHLPDPVHDPQFEKALAMAEWAHENDR